MIYYYFSKIFSRSGYVLRSKNIFLTSKKYCTSPKIAENEFAHNVLLSHGSYLATTCDFQKLKLCHDSSLEENIRKKKNIISTLIGINILDIPSLSHKDKNPLQKLSDNDLITVFLNLLILSEATNIKSYYSLYHILNKEFIKRSELYHINKILLLADIWYSVNSLSYISLRYDNYVVHKLFSILHHLNMYQFTQLFFYLNLCRSFKFGARQAEIENKILKTIDYIDVEEIGIISLGLFKTQNFIANVNLLEKIIEKIILNKTALSFYTLNTLLKILRKSLAGNEKSHGYLYSKLVTELHSEVGKFNNFVLMQIASLGSNFHCYDINVLNSVFDHFKKIISHARLKEIERQAFALFSSGIKDFLLIHLMEEELLKPSRQEEIHSFPNCFLACVYYLTSMNHYNEILISQALKLKWDLNGPKEGLNCNQLYEIDQMVEIEFKKNYKGYRIPKCHSEEFEKKILPRLPSWTEASLNRREREFLEFRDNVMEVLGENFVKTTSILPFSIFPDIIFCTGRRSKIQKFPSDIFTHLPHELKCLPKNNLIWHSIVPVNIDSCLYNSKRFKGLFQRDNRLKKALGYNVILIRRPSKKNRCKEEEINIITKTLEKFLNRKAPFSFKILGN